MHLLLLISHILLALTTSLTQCRQLPGVPDEKWGYVTVRPKAHMFWWLYGAHRDTAPLILWYELMKNT